MNMNVSMILLGYSRRISAQSHEVQIKAARTASNTALKVNDWEGIFDVLINDVQITTGAGTLLCGKQALRTYIENATNNQPMYWVRSTNELIANEVNGLAWESGIWNGYHTDDQQESNSIVHGKYAAMWTLKSGEWKIKSQLFVSLE